MQNETQDEKYNLKISASFKLHATEQFCAGKLLCICFSVLISSCAIQNRFERVITLVNFGRKTILREKYFVWKLIVNLLVIFYATINRWRKGETILFKLCITWQNYKQNVYSSVIYRYISVLHTETIRGAPLLRERWNGCT